MGYFLITLIIYAGAYAVGGFALDVIGARGRGRGERLVFSSAFGIGLLALTVLILGVPGLYYRATAFILIALPAALFPKRFLEFFHTLAQIPRLLMEENRDVFRRLLIFFVLLVLAITMLSCFKPATATDALRYHLSVPRQFIMNHRIIDIPSLPESYFYLNPAMLYLVGLLVRDQVLCTFMHWGAMALAVGAMYLFFRRHAGKGAAAAIFLLVTQPILPWIGTVAADMFFQTLFMAAGFYLFLEFIENGNVRKLAVASAFFGLAIGTKLTTLGLMIGVQLFLFYHVLLENRRGIPAAIKYSFILWLPAGIMAAPWAIKTFIMTGNPVFPVMSGVFETRNLAPFFNEYSSFYGSLSVKEFFTYFWKMTTEFSPYRAAPVSPVILGFLPLPFIVGRMPVRVKKIIVYSLVLYAIHWCLKIRVDRYMMIVFFIFTTALGWSAHRMIESGGFKKIITAVFMVILAGYSIGISAVGNESVVTSIKCALKPEYSLEIVRGRLMFLDLVLRANENINLEPGEKFVYGQDFAPDTFYIDGPFILARNYHQGVVDYSTLGSAEAIRNELVSRGGAYIFDCMKYDTNKWCIETPDPLMCPWSEFIDKYVQPVDTEDYCITGKIL